VIIIVIIIIVIIITTIIKKNGPPFPLLTLIVDQVLHCEDDIEDGDEGIG